MIGQQVLFTAVCDAYDAAVPRATFETFSKALVSSRGGAGEVAWQTGLRSAWATAHTLNVGLNEFTAFALGFFDCVTQSSTPDLDSTRARGRGGAF